MVVALGLPVRQHWRQLLYHIQIQEVNIIPEYITVSPRGPLGLFRAGGQKWGWCPDCRGWGSDGDVGGSWYSAAFSHRHLETEHTAVLTGAEDSLTGLLLILSAWGFFLFVLGFGGDGGVLGFFFCQILCALPWGSLALPVTSCAQPARGIQSLTLLCSPGVGMQIHTSLTCPSVLLCPGTLTNSSHTSYGSNFKKANAGPGISTVFLLVRLLGLLLVF